MEQKKACGLHCLRINHLSVRAGNADLIRDINLHIHCGELTTVIGRNGAGKSTLLKAILGEVPYTGEIVFRDRENGKVQKLTVGSVPQTLNIDRNSPASVYDLFASFLTNKPVFFYQSKKLKKKLIEQLELFQAGRLIDQRVGSLSGGELQRVMLSIATTPKPDLLILDEPVSGVDKNGLHSFYQTVTWLKNDFDMAVLLVSHDLEFVARYADQVVLLDQTILCRGTAKEVFHSPQFRENFGAFSFEGFQNQGKENR